MSVQILREVSLTRLHQLCRFLLLSHLTVRANILRIVNQEKEDFMQASLMCISGRDEAHLLKPVLQFCPEEEKL